MISISNIDIDPYILNDKNILNYLKYDFTTHSLNKSSIVNDFTNINNNEIETSVNPVVQLKKTVPIPPQSLSQQSNITENLLIPLEQDSLFWCYYIISFGSLNYEMLNYRNSLLAKQIKIELVNKLRSNKPILKIYKYDTLINIESNLVNDQIIDIKSVMSLFAIDNINVIYVKGKTYYELLFNEKTPVYIIREKEVGTKYVKKYGFEIGNNDSIDKIKTTLYKIDKLDKPIKSLTYYKVQDLIDICEKLSIETQQHGKNKTKTKNELYEAIVQYF